MANNLGESSVIAPAGNSVLREILRHRGPSKPHVLTLRNRGAASVLLAWTRLRDGVTSAVLADEQTAVAADNNPAYTGTGSQKVFTGGVLAADAVVPGTLTVVATATSPALQDVNGDGVLWQQAGARKQASGGTFAAMASEVMTVSVDGGAAQTVTFGTEATIGDAAAVITAALTGATAAPQGAEDVDITSDTTGEGSSIEVLTVDAGITAKLGITAGLSTNEAGTVDYFSGALELSYQGYDPDTDPLTSSYTDTPEVAAGAEQTMRVATVGYDDELILSAFGNNAPSLLEADVRPMVRQVYGI